VSTTTDHGLVCFDGNDYAAIALAMQHDAFAVEAALDSISDSFDIALTDPYFIGVTTATNGPLASGGEQLFGIGAWSLLTSNFTPVPTTAANAGFRVTIPRTGWYGYGVYANQVAAGAVTAFSRRTLIGRATLQQSGNATQLSQITWRTADTNTAGEFLIASGGTFRATAGTTVDVEAYWSHTNAASSVSIPAGARIWFHFLGSGVEIGSQ
jgi:hypothetical protein